MLGYFSKSLCFSSAFCLQSSRQASSSKLRSCGPSLVVNAQWMRQDESISFGFAKVYCVDGNASTRGQAQLGNRHNSGTMNQRRGCEASFGAAKNNLSCSVCVQCVLNLPVNVPNCRVGEILQLWLSRSPRVTRVAAEEWPYKHPSRT
jgi:ribosomal protein L40E